MRRLAGPAVLTALATGAAVPAGAHAATKTVTAGTQSVSAGAPAGAVFEQFFPKVLTINAGDTVRWRVLSTHTATFVPRGQQPPAFVLPEPGAPVMGSNDVAGVPFWFNGQLELRVNPPTAFPTDGTTYDGTAYRNSGFATRAPIDYALQFPKPGTYRYLCIPHPGMVGTVKVLPPGAKVPSAAEDRRAVRRQLQRDVRIARAAVRLGPPRGDTVAVGRDRETVVLRRFFPQTKVVKVGNVVTFAFTPRSAEAHTVTFGDDAYRTEIQNRLLRPVFVGAGPPSLRFDARGVYSSDPLPVNPPYDGTLHGNGFLNSGILDADDPTPLPPTFKVLFTKPDTYTYECLVHPAMNGRIVVRRR